ncbi:zinc finger protein CONSTANS-LIKE 9-like isoform X2 [Oryza glaberrima]|uniref:zinc finger protein CONSTANS-LIKE 9-like isoform X2 n=1 Tax=Oryza glaberrima TaxID=4538 RepID=UPI00224C49F6|nr:zinc finger protein CONSTANS-LIKE 9-like isoform X2 [Oryza glaberrima]
MLISHPMLSNSSGSFHGLYQYTYISPTLTKEWKQTHHYPGRIPLNSTVEQKARKVAVLVALSASGSAPVLYRTMDALCDFCGEQRSMVYCRSDAASLCLSCDRNVHSANALSRRHTRTLLCDRCVGQPAAVRCLEENTSLCQNCDWNGHGAASSAAGHKRQTINCYSGCPSSAELSRIWSFSMDIPTVAAEPNCEEGINMMSINDNDVNNHCGAPEDGRLLDIASTALMSDLPTGDKFKPLIGSSSGDGMNLLPLNSDQPAEPVSTTPKAPCVTDKDMFNDGSVYGDFCVDDADLTFENYEELFGTSHVQTEQLFDDAGIDSYFEMKDVPADESNEPKPVQPECSNVASVDSGMSNPAARADSSHCIPGRQAISNISLSFSGLTGESSAGDFQDCGVSSMILMGEPPWHPPGPESSSAGGSRDNALTRYKEKKKRRKFDKKIRYASRKARADVRKRVKGRFVKAGEAYDYDPLSQTRSY